MTKKTAFKKLKAEIDRIFPVGRFVAIDEGKILADAGSFDELDKLLDARGLTSNKVLVVQAGIHEPEKVFIFLRKVGR